MLLFSMYIVSQYSENKNVKIVQHYLSPETRLARLRRVFHPSPQLNNLVLCAIIPATHWSAVVLI